MSNPEIIAIAALGKDTKFICAEDKLLWHNPEDLQRVKELTLGYPLIMGRKTHESIGRPLPKRTNIVMTRDENYAPAGCKVAHSVDEALSIAQQSEGGTEKIFIFGGAEIYTLFLDRTDTLMLTIVDSDKEGTHTFPEFTDSFTPSNHRGKGTFEGEDFEWVDYTRIR